MMGDDPPYLSVGTEVSAKYKGAFCEAKIRKVVKSVKCKILFKQGLGIASVPDDVVKGNIRVGSVIEARHPERKEFVEGTITKIQDCSQYTVVFDDGDITTLRRTALCLKSGRHFAESETLDQLPLTHPEHFGNPVIGGRRGRRRGADSSDEEETTVKTKAPREEKEADIGRVVCVEGDKKKQRDNWFPGLVVAPTAQDTVRIHVREEYLVRSFKDGRYYTVPKKETNEFTREAGAKVDNHSVKAAVEKALLFLDKDELPPHWDRDLLFGLNEPTNFESDHDTDSDNPDDEPREEKDHFVAQLYKFMDDRGTPINQGPTICSRDVDLYRLFYVVHNLGGYNRVTNHNHWKVVSRKLGYGQSPVNVNLVKHVYRRFLHSFEEFYRKLGCTMVNHPRTYRNRSRSGRSLIRDKDRLSISGGKRESKDRSDADESEEASIAGSLGTLQDVDIKMEIEETIPEPPPPPPVAPPPKPKVIEIKEEPAPKKSVEKEKPPVIKIKEEKKEEEVKPKTDIVEPVKEKPRMRRTKLKTNSTTPETTPVKKEIKKEPEVKEELKPVEKEKKKRLFTRGLKKEKGSLMKCGPGLAITRQKRAIKERVKAFVDKFKFRLTKEPPPPPSEIVEKPVVPIKEKPVLPIKEKPPKIKEETPSTSTTVVKKKEEMPKEAGPPIEEKKKVGRKKKEKKDQEEPFDSLPTYKSVCVGDKLKVYYGPTHESKVTYEAKVLSIKTDGPEVMYLVHYTGWNNRYDEYIKHSRIADNLSWVPGRAAKKPSMSFLKPGRRKNSISKSENPMKTEGGMNKGEGGPNMGKPDGPPPPNNQNKITKSVTVTRSSSRNSKKDEPLSEADEDTDCSMPSLYMDEFMCEKTHNQIVKEILGISDESNLVNVTEKRKMKRRGAEEASKSGESKMEQKGSDDSRSVEETTPSPKMDRRRERRTPQSEQEGQEGEKKTRLISRRRRSSSTNEDKSDNNISADPDSTSSADEKKKTRNRSVLDSPESGGTPRKRRFVDKKSDIKPVESTSQHSVSTDEESTQKSSGPDAEDASKGRDFDLIQIRSELKGLDKALKAEEEPFKSITAESKSASEKKAENDKLAEDIYEFKEPEPFEFEARKSSDDKGKPQRRPLGRLFDDSKKHSSVLLPNIFYKGKKENKAEEPNKSFLNSIYNFEVESFEKITSSPRRLVEETSCKPIQLFTDSPDEDNNEEETKKSPNPLLNVTYNIAKDDIFNTTFSKNEDPASPGSASPKSTSPIDADINENSNFDSNEVESTSKSCFSRDDDEDELEDESINFAIQRAIKQDISDDEDMPPHPPSMIQIESSIFSGTDDKIMDKPVIVEAVNADDKDAFENCEIVEKNDKSEGDDKSDDHISTGSDIESDFILTSGDRDEENLHGSVTVENITVAAIVTSPVIVASTLVEDSIVVETAELEATTTILTPITVPADIKDDTIEFSANEGDIEELGDEAIFPLSSPPDTKSNDEPLIEPIAATVQVETNESDHSNTEMDAINDELQEEEEDEDEDDEDDDDEEEDDDDDDDVDEEEEEDEEEEGLKIESDCEFTFKPITVPPPDESESTVSIPFNDGKPEQDEIIINLEPLKSDKESKVDLEDDGKADLNLASLLCEETIPGSPSSHVECTEQTDEEKIDVPTVEIIEQKIERIEEIMTLPIVEEIVRTEEPLQASAESAVSSPSNSPRAERSGSPPAVDNDSSKSLRECEMDLENFVEQKEESEDESKTDKTPTKPEIVRKVGSIKRTKPVKKQHCETVKRRYKRSRHTGSDSDDTSENSISTNPCYSQSSVVPPLNTDPKDPHTSEAIKSCKYNFLVSLDPHMDQNTRIGMLQTSIQQIRKVYADLKSELAVVDRRRKKLRKRERENLAAVRLH